ncbi:MAG: hypothetical protein WC985_03050 [Thermoplasmata archaeon]
MSKAADGFRWTRRGSLFLEAGILLGIVPGGAGLTYWVSGPATAVLVVLEGLL